MPKLVAWLLNGLRLLLTNRLGQWVAGAMAWLGIAWSSQTLVVDPVLGQLEAYAQSGFGSGSFATAALAWAGVLNFDIALTMVISAVATKHAVGAGKLFLTRR